MMKRILGAAALFSGAALVAHILSGISLRLTLLFTAALLAVAILLTARRSTPKGREWLRRLAIAGSIAGAVATICYDAAKYALSRLSPTQYNPFEVVHAFGMLLAGSGASPAMIYGAGVAFHLLNGVSFGIAFSFLFRRRSVLTGIAWGLFLEIFQLTLYPGWLDIRSYAEFMRVSVVAHIIYGVVLSLVSQWLLPADRIPHSTTT
jgi:hypothetical protein